MLTFLLLGGVGGLLGLVGALAFGTTMRRVGVVAAAGIVAAAALFAYGYLSAETVTSGNACHDCERWHGRYMSVFNFLVPFFNGVAWVGGAGLGGVLRWVWMATRSETSR